MEQDVVGKLDLMNKNIIAIREHLEDIMLTRDDLDSIREADEDLMEGRTTRLD